MSRFRPSSASSDQPSRLAWWVLVVLALAGAGGWWLATQLLPRSPAPEARVLPPPVPAFRPEVDASGRVAADGIVPQDVSVARGDGRTDRMTSVVPEGEQHVAAVAGSDHATGLGEEDGRRLDAGESVGRREGAVTGSLEPGRAESEAGDGQRGSVSGGAGGAERAPAGARPLPPTDPAVLALLRERQEQLMRDAAQGSPPRAHTPPPTSMDVLSSQPRREPDTSGLDAELEAIRENSRRMLHNAQRMQTEFIEGLVEVPPDEAPRMMATLERFDQYAQEMGLPPVLDLDRVRQALEGSQRLQQLQTEITAEAAKGEEADQARIEALRAEIEAEVARLPTHFVQDYVMNLIPDADADAEAQAAALVEEYQRQIQEQIEPAEQP